jgi:hypothetical protein
MHAVVTAGKITDYKPAINTYREDKRGERRAAGYRFVASCNTDSKIEYVYDGWDHVSVCL